MRVLLVEDDFDLGSALKAGLRLNGFQLDWVRDGFAALHELGNTEYAAVVLDLGLPRIDGLRVLQDIRHQKRSCPVLVLTARDAPEDIARALDLGADDYVVKPTDLLVLAARLRALIRRCHAQNSAIIEHNGLRIDTSTRQVWAGEEALQLSPREYDILQTLVMAAGRILTREALEAQILSWGQEVESNALEVHIHHLRKKLGPAFRNHIVTVRGIGYQIRV